jgi:hypothetical protein
MDISLDPKISLLERVKLQSAVLVPVLKALRAELGEDRANKLVYEALRDWSRCVYEELASRKSGCGKDKWREISEELDPLIGQDVEVEYLRDDTEARDFNVTGCRYAQFFLQLGETELGSILTCEIDDHVAAVGYPEVELNRPQTIMSGSQQCHFRYRFKK